MTEQLTPDLAAVIAKENGLSMSDAAALLQLADTDDHARSIAATFAKSVDSDRLADDILGGR